MASVCFSTPRLSPVRALSSTFRLWPSSSRPSAGTTSPASSRTRSPTVSSRVGSGVTAPPRIAFASGPERVFRLLSERSALAVWTVPSTAFKVITSRITAILSRSPRNPETMAATIRITTRKSRNCSRKTRNRLLRLPSASALGPHRFCRARISSSVNGLGPPFTCSRTSATVC